jgi:hypothetical protein
VAALEAVAINSELLKINVGLVESPNFGGSETVAVSSKE